MDIRAIRPVLFGAAVLAFATGCGVDAPLPGGWMGPDARVVPVAPKGEEDIRAGLQKPITFQFENIPVRDVLWYLDGFTGIPMILDPSAGAAGERSVTLRVSEIRTEDALNQLLRQAGLHFDLRDGALRVHEQ